MLHIRFINNLVLGKIDAIRLLNRVTFCMFRIGSRNKQVFEIRTPSTNYLCNDPIQ